MKQSPHQSHGKYHDSIRFVFGIGRSHRSIHIAGSVPGIVNAKMLTSLLIAAVLSGGIKVGEHAPDFTVTAHTKEKVSLSDFKGQKVILWFYPRASTGG